MFGAYRNSEGERSVAEAMKRIRRLGGTRRFWEIDKLERYYAGNQHDGKPSWWDGEVPARERHPCVLSGLPKAAVEQAVRFTLGEGKFPQLRFEGSEEKRAIAGIDLSLSVEEAETLDRLWSEISKQIKIKLVFREALRRGLATRTCCGVFSIRDGELSVELFNSKHCEITWETGFKKAPKSLECRYIFPREELENGNPKEVWYWYRRVINAQSDIVYNEVRVEDGDEPKWTVNPELSADHNSGMCPVFWWGNLPRMDVKDDDGVALIDGCEDEIDAIDYALSVRHTGAFVYGSPQAWETGVVDGKGPDNTGRTAGTIDYFNTIGPDGTPAGIKGFRSNEKPARKRSAFTNWTYEDIEVKVGLLETNGGAEKMVTAHITDLRARLLEAIQVVLLDPSSVAGNSDMSAKLLELMYAPLLALVDDLRECWGDHLRAFCSQLFRFLSHHHKAGSTIFLSSLDEAAPILERFNVQLAAGGVTWLPPESNLSWGDYFAPTAADIREAVELARSARGGKTAGDKNDSEGEPLITRKRAVEYIAPYFGIENVDAELEELDEEREEKRAEEEERAEAELQAALTQLDAKAGANGAGKAPGSASGKTGGDSGRTKGGKDDSSAGSKKPKS